MGRFQGVQPKLRKVGVRPTLMIRPATTPTFLLTLAQDAPQTHAYPFVDRLKRGVVAVPKVTKPSLQCAVDVGDNGWQAPAVGTTRLGTKRRFQPLDALGPGPTISTLEVIARKGTTAGLAYRRDRADSAPRPLGRVPLGVTWASPLASRRATATGRIEFVTILWTGRSPAVALHLPSRGRSYLPLQSSGPTLTRTFTSLIRCARKRTSRGFQPAVRVSHAQVATGPILGAGIVLSATVRIPPPFPAGLGLRLRRRRRRRRGRGR